MEYDGKKEVSDLARICYICGKKPMAGDRISKKGRNHTKRRWLPNLQRVRIETQIGDNRVRNKRVRVCVKCIRSGKIVKVASGAPQPA